MHIHSSNIVKIASTLQSILFSINPFGCFMCTMQLLYSCNLMPADFFCSSFTVSKSPELLLICWLTNLATWLVQVNPFKNRHATSNCRFIFCKSDLTFPMNNSLRLQLFSARETHVSAWLKHGSISLPSGLSPTCSGTGPVPGHHKMTQLFL